MSIRRDLLLRTALLRQPGMPPLPPLPPLRAAAPPACPPPRRKGKPAARRRLARPADGGSSH